MIPTASSRNGVPIRLTDERWTHIIEEHGEVATLRQEVLLAVSDAERVLRGTAAELLAVRILSSDAAIVTVYRETSPDDGLIITAFITRRLGSLDRREQLWPPKA